MIFILAEVSILDDKVYQLWTYERALLSRYFAVIISAMKTSMTIRVLIFP